MKPYRDLEITKEYVIREFDKNIDPINLLWHRDDEDRTIEVLKTGEEWGFQFDNELPFKLQPNIPICISRHQWHRVIKGQDNLILKIYKQ